MEISKELRDYLIADGWKPPVKAHTTDTKMVDCPKCKNTCANSQCLTCNNTGFVEVVDAK